MGALPVVDPLEPRMPASLRPRRRSPTVPPSPRQHTRVVTKVVDGSRLPRLVGIAAGAALLVMGLASPAMAQAADPTLGQVIDRLRTVLVGLLVGLATLLLTVGGVRYLLAGGDPGQVEKAKITLRSAAIGYGLAVLAPVLVRLLRYVVGS
jgi:Type IV secretion system pilin